MSQMYLSARAYLPHPEPGAGDCGFGRKCGYPNRASGGGVALLSKVDAKYEVIGQGFILFQ